MTDFNVNQFVNDLNIAPLSAELDQARDLIALKHILYNDAWTVRQSCYNEAYGMLSHLRYIGGTLLANAERRLNTLDGNGIMSEALDVNWGKAPNAEQPNINDEISKDDQAQNQREFIDQLKYRMAVCAVSYVLHVQEHDDISRDLEQLTFSAIQARSQVKRAA
jgi:hypothetical protein